MPSLKPEQLRLVAELKTQLKESNLAIFAGAGLSAGAGYVNWNQLLKPIADDLGLDSSKETDMVALAQYHCNANLANRAKLNELLVTNFSATARPTENHRILARLPISTYWTTNYDKVIETALSGVQKQSDVKYKPKQLAFTKPHRDAVVYKMHGDVDHPGEAILTRDDYETYHKNMRPFLNALSGDLISKTFLFLGFSFTDPNLEYILSRVRIAYDRDQRQHHAILRRVQKGAEEPQADFEYRNRKQELFVNDLLRFGVKTTWIEHFDELTDILAQLEKEFKKDTVFISGAAAEYGPWARDEADRFAYLLGKDIAATGRRVVSGFGLGIGASVITGVLENAYMHSSRLDRDQLILRPFPQHQNGSMPLAELWSAYRKDMLSYAGVAIFLFGNKLQEGKVVLSNGMREEFEIAKSQGAFLIPVGITGYMAQEFWGEVRATFPIGVYQKEGDIMSRLFLLGEPNTTLDQARGAVIELLRLLE